MEAAAGLEPGRLTLPNHRLTKMTAISDFLTVIDVSDLEAEHGVDASSMRFFRPGSFRRAWSWGPGSLVAGSLRGGLCGNGALGCDSGVVLLGTRLLEGKGQALFVFERGGDAMQLPDQLVKLAGAANIHVAMVQ